MPFNERAPQGYDKKDKPLYHDFFYKFDLSMDTTVKNATILTFLKTSKDSVDPAGIQVNNLNAGFDVETGPIVCYDSIVQQMQIITSYSITQNALTAIIKKLRVYESNIHAAFEDSWTPADEVSTATIAQLCDVVSDTTKEDVTPAFNGTNLVQEQDQPVSNKVFPTDAFANWDLSTNLSLEGVTIDKQVDEDAKRYYTNGNKLMSVTSKWKPHLLTESRPSWTEPETKFTPRQCRYGNPHMYFGKRVWLPQFTDPHQVGSDGITPGTGSMVTIQCRVQYAEWNPEFDQTRM